MHLSYRCMKIDLLDTLVLIGFLEVRVHDLLRPIIRKTFYKKTDDRDYQLISVERRINNFHAKM